MPGLEIERLNVFVERFFETCGSEDGEVGGERCAVQPERKENKKTEKMRYAIA